MKTILKLLSSLLLSYLIAVGAAHAALQCKSLDKDDAGYENGRANIDLKTDGQKNYSCRIVGNCKSSGFEDCALLCSGPDNPLFCISPFDAGYPDKPRTWEFVNKTNRYCRFVGGNDVTYPYKDCSEISLVGGTLTEGQHYADIKPFDPYPGSCTCGDGTTLPSRPGKPNSCNTQEYCNDFCAGYGGGTCSGYHPKK